MVEPPSPTAGVAKALSAGLSTSIGDAQDPTRVIACPIGATDPATPYFAPRAADSMFQLILSDHIVSCVSWVLYANGLEDLGPLGLGTTDTPWGVLLPALKKAYPGAPVLLNVTPTFTPRVASYRDRGLVGNWDFNVSMGVNQSGVSTYTNTLDLRAQFGFALAVQTLPGGANATLVGNVTKLNLTASVIDSAIGPMPGISIKELANVLGPIIEKLINALLGKGIPISPKGGLLSNGTVFTEDGFITLAADFAKLL